MARKLLFEGVEGSYDAANFAVEIIDITAPFTAYVQAQPDGTLMSVELPDAAPDTLDAQIAQLAALHAYERTELRERNVKEAIRKVNRKQEKMIALKAEIHNLETIPQRRPEDADAALSIIYDILKDLEDN